MRNAFSKTFSLSPISAALLLALGGEAVAASDPTLSTAVAPPSWCAASACAAWAVTRC